MSNLFFRSRKAQEAATSPLMMILKFVLSAMVIMVIFYFMAGTNKVFAGDEGKNTAESLKAFAHQLALVVNGTNNNSVADFMSIGEDQVIAVFGSGNKIVDTCQSNEEVRKSDKECGNNVCVCSYHEDELDKEPYECIKIENAIIGEIAAEPYSDFGANLGQTYDATNGKAYAMIYGNCDGWTVGPMGVKSILIEKKGSYILISDNACANFGGQCYSSECSDNSKVEIFMGCPDDRKHCCA